MGFFSNLVSATIKTALTPIAVVKDTIEVVAGYEATHTKDLLDDAKDDLCDAFDKLSDGDL